jgi:hypothetical protein
MNGNEKAAFVFFFFYVAKKNLILIRRASFASNMIAKEKTSLRA